MSKPLLKEYIKAQNFTSPNNIINTLKGMYSTHYMWFFPMLVESLQYLYNY